MSCQRRDAFKDSPCFRCITKQTALERQRFFGGVAIDKKRGRWAWPPVTAATLIRERVFLRPLGETERLVPGLERPHSSL